MLQKSRIYVRNAKFSHPYFMVNNGNATETQHVSSSAKSLQLFNQALKNVSIAYVAIQHSSMTNAL